MDFKHCISANGTIYNCGEMVESKLSVSEPKENLDTADVKEASDRSALQPISNEQMNERQGKVLSVETNYLVVKMENMPQVAYHYKVKITPGNPEKEQRKLIFKAFKELFFKNIVMVFDNNFSVYTIVQLRFKSFVGGVPTMNGSKKEYYTVELAEAPKLIVNLDEFRQYLHQKSFKKPNKAFCCLNAVLSNPCFTNGERFGKSFYRSSHLISTGVEIRSGFSQTTIFRDKFLLNVDINYKYFISKSTVLGFLSKSMGTINFNQLLTPRAHQHVKSILYNMEIIFELSGLLGLSTNSFKIVDISTESAANLKLDYWSLDSTVANYCAAKGYNLLYPNFNCLMVRAGDFYIYLPFECCTIKRQSYSDPIKSKLHDSMSVLPTITSKQRKARILESVKQFNHNADPIIQNFGMRVKTEFLKVPVHSIDPPEILYVGGKDKNSLYGGPSFNWAFLYFDESLKFGPLNSFMDRFYRKSKDILHLESPSKDKLIYSKNYNSDFRKLKERNCAFIIVVLSRSGPTYTAIKQSGELRHGIVIQCIKEFNVRKERNEKLIGNMLWKINAKLNGVNKVVKNLGNLNFGDDILFLGGTQRQPLQSQLPFKSVVGFAASYDKNGFLYSMSYGYQEPNVEPIQNIRLFVKHHFHIYFQQNKNYPKHLFYYRYGMTDQTFRGIRNIEIQGIRNALRELKAEVKLTCIVVAKRNHTRFFPPEESHQKYFNVSPGTVVDSEIVNRNFMEFLLVSHKTSQGTAKPTRYVVIEDDNNFSLNDVQKLSYDLCHLYQGSEKSISLPTPIHLANSAASKAIVYIKGNRNVHTTNVPQVFPSHTNNLFHFV